MQLIVEGQGVGDITQLSGRACGGRKGLETVSQEAPGKVTQKEGQ